MAVLFTDKELEQKYLGQTVLSISHRVLNPVTVIQEALKQYRNNHAFEPPRNTSFRVVWFIQRNKLCPFRTFLIFNYPSPRNCKQITFGMWVFLRILWILHRAIIWNFKTL